MFGWEFQCRGCPRESCCRDYGQRCVLYRRGWPGASCRHCWLVVELLFALMVRRVPGPYCLGVSGVAQGLAAGVA